MLVYGKLEYAQLEGRTTDHAATVVGMLWWDTTLKQVRMADGSSVFNILANNTKCIFGSHATPANNIRFHRGASGVLQFVSAADTTAEGTLSTSLNQISGRMENYATASLPAVGNIGRLVYDTSSASLKFDTGIAWQEVAAGLNTSVKNFVLAENLSAGVPVSVNDDGELTAVKQAKLVVGSNTQFGPALSTIYSMCYDNINNKVVICYVDLADGFLKAVVGTPTPASISFGTPVVIQGSASSFVSCCFTKGMEKVLVCYTNGLTTSMTGKCVLGTVSGTTIAFGTEYQFSPNQISSLKCLNIKGSKFAILYADAEDSNFGKAILADVIESIDLISFASYTVSAFSAVAVESIDACYDEKNDLMLIVYKETAAELGYAIAANINVTTITYSTSLEVSGVTSIISNIACTYHKEEQIPLVAFNASSFGKGVLRGLTLYSGAYIPRDILLFTDSPALGISIIYDHISSRVVIFYEYNGAEGRVACCYYDENKYLYVDGEENVSTSIDTVSIPNTMIIDELNNRVGYLLIDDSDSDVPKYGSCRLLTPNQAVGVLNASGVIGETKAVTMFGGLYSGFSGKVIGSKAYIQRDGSLGYNRTKYALGTFISATELLVSKGE